MEEVKIKDKNGYFQKLKPETIPDLSSLLSVVRKKYPYMDQNWNLTYVPEDRNVYHLKNEEDFQVMKTFKSIKIFFDSTDLSSIKANSSSEINSSTTQEHEKIEFSKGESLQSEEIIKNISGDNSEFKKEEEKSEERRDQLRKRQETSELNQEQKKVVDSKDESTKEHQRQKQQKIESQNLSSFFICKVCQVKYPDGVHYRCLQCFDYDVCEDCFNKKIYKETDHKTFDHEFISIESREEWESIDFRPVIRLFLDPYYKDRAFLQMHKITHSDMISKGKQGHPTYFEKEMKEWKKEYERRINNNIENWIGEFQQLQKQHVQL